MLIFSPPRKGDGDKLQDTSSDGGDIQDRMADGKTFSVRYDLKYLR